MKIENLKFELGENLDLHFKVKFHGESNGGSLDALKRCLNPEIGLEGLIGAKKCKIWNLSLGKSYITNRGNFFQFIH